MDRNVKCAKELLRLARLIVSDKDSCPYSVGQDIRVVGRVEKNYLDGHLCIQDSSDIMIVFEAFIPYVTDTEAKAAWKKRFFEAYNRKFPNATKGDIEKVYHSLSSSILEKHVKEQKEKMQNEKCDGIKSDWKGLLDSQKYDEVAFDGKVTHVVNEDTLLSYRRWTVFVDIK